MDKFKKIVAYIGVLMGLLFLFNGVTDIQVGFGSVLVLIGLLHV